jgi:hypothetical protein
VQQVAASIDGEAREHEKTRCDAEEGVVPFSNKGAARIRVEAAEDGIVNRGCECECSTGKKYGCCEIHLHYRFAPSANAYGDQSMKYIASYPRYIYELPTLLPAKTYIPQLSMDDMFLP